jgi:phosphatidylglycerol:prolipoprotein diacylglycerol transferase
VIPYIDVPPIHLGPFVIYLFGVFASLAVVSGHLWMLGRAKRTGLDPSIVNGMAFWVFLVGFPVSVVVKWFYYPDFLVTLWTAPGELFRGGFVMSSFGGVIGGLAGGIGFLMATGQRNLALWRYVDVIAWAFPRAFIFGRLGCSVAHDHPGIRTASLLGVQYPGGTRYDLGVLEVFFLLLLVGFIALLDRPKRPAGFFLGVFLAMYGAFRFALDSLHEAPPAYFGISVDHWFGGAAFVIGLIVLMKARRQPQPAGPRAETTAKARRAFSQ